MTRTRRIERAPSAAAWDSRSRRALSELGVFFPRWGGLQKKGAALRAFSTELFWVRPDSEHVDWSRLGTALAGEILEDPLCRVADASSFLPWDTLEEPERRGYRWWCLEKRLQPGVTDNAGHVLEEALRMVAGCAAECRSGSRLWIELPASEGEGQVRAYADEVFHNALIERVDVWVREEAVRADRELFDRPEWREVRASRDERSNLVERFDVARMELKDLVRLSEARLWALTKGELACVRDHYAALGRAMTDVEIEVIAQTWSEHCKHKIFAANIEVTNERDDYELPARVESVFKTYIRGATREIPAKYLRSVFEDNAGVIRVTSEHDCAIKVETHNSPSALDPYGGALTGIVGVNRDILGVGLGAQPIANLDVFCVGPIELDETKTPLPPRLHHPRRILEGVRVGVEHGGNKSGVPTVTGAVVHHPGFLGKPLVFCGTIGILPTDRDLIHKEIKPGDRIVMAGGRIGKDGIHGATFSSLEMNESSPVSAVQLGDPLTQRRVWDFLLEARDRGLFRAVTDNGAGGLSSSIGELARLCGKRGGARLEVSAAPTKYEGLKPFELVISESQERMSFAVAPERLEAFLALGRARGVECADLGEFEDSGRFRIQYRGEAVAELDMHFLHEGLPAMELKAVARKPTGASKRGDRVGTRIALRHGAWQDLGARAWSMGMQEMLPAVLALPNVRTRRPIVQQYDHEVQARSVRKPYGTPGHSAPNDGATLRLGRVGYEGIALGLGLAPAVALLDPKVAAELALDEAVRNAVVAGMDPAHAALVDNFCWPDPLPGPHNPDAEEKLGALVMTCKRIFEGAVALRMPFVSGKDSMKNDYRMGDVKISVPPTILITAMGKVHDVRQVPLGYAVRGNDPRRVLWVCGQLEIPGELGLPIVDFERTYRFLGCFHRLLREGRIESAHDVSDGGWLVATAELLFGTGVGAELQFGLGDVRPGEPSCAALFGEPATSFVLLAREADVSAIQRVFADFTVLDVGRTAVGDSLRVGVELAGTRMKADWLVSDLERAYHGEDAR